MGLKICGGVGDVDISFVTHPTLFTAIEVTVQFKDGSGNNLGRKAWFDITLSEYDDRVSNTDVSISPSDVVDGHYWLILHDVGQVRTYRMITDDTGKAKFGVKYNKQEKDTYLLILDPATMGYYVSDLIELADWS